MMKYFNSFEKLAFRLELLQKYDVEEEKDSFVGFMNDGKVSNSPEWEDIIKEAKNRGAKMSRVHVLKFPLTDYLKYELECYKYNQEAGEDVLLINKSSYDELGLNNLIDFWIFDDEVVLKMQYSPEGKFLGYETLTVGIDNYIQAKNLLLKKSVSMSQFHIK